MVAKYLKNDKKAQTQIRETQASLLNFANFSQNVKFINICDLTHCTSIKLGF